jgi:hypothetical protein
MSDSRLLIKIGAGAYGTETPVNYPDVWSVEQTTGPERLRVGPSGGCVGVLLSLAEVWRENYYLLYVLLVPRLGQRESGRFQSPGPLSFNQVASFCRRFRPFLEGDGRHHLWIGSTAGAGLLIYDHHDWIWAYGDLVAYIDVLKGRGFREAEIKLPAPHSHNYHAEYDTAEDEIVDYCAWSYFPLQAGDDY